MTGVPELELDSPHVTIPRDAVAAFCERWGITKMRLVGSAKTGPFRSASDVDLLFFAPWRAPIYGFDARPQKSAVDELCAIVGRRVDLVCSRATVQNGNPYAIYNLLVAGEHDRMIGLLWYMHAAVQTLRRIALPDPSEALADSRRAAHVMNALLRFARTCDKDERVAEWRRRGIDAPWEKVREVLGPTLDAARDLERVRWPADDVLATLVGELAPSFDAIEKASAEAAAAHPAPVTPRAVIEEALGDIPRERARDAPWPSADHPELFVRSPFLPLPETRLRVFCRTWGIHKLVLVGSAMNGPFKPTSDVDFLFYASHAAPLYERNGRVVERARDELQRMVGRKTDLVCARRVVMIGNTFATYNFLVETRFSRQDCWLWHMRDHVRLLSRVPDDAEAMKATAAMNRATKGLMGLARAWDRPERIATWERLGLGDVPWPALTAAFSPIVAAIKSGAEIRWPGPEALASLTSQVRPFFPRMRALCDEMIGGREPVVPRALLIEAVGDMEDIERRRASSR